MSRIRNAWRALLGAEPEVVVREVEVLGPPANVEPVKLYTLANKAYSYSLLSKEAEAVKGKFFFSCDQAFEAIPTEKDRQWMTVEEDSFIRVGNRYFRSSSEVKVTKPKRDKGAK